MIFKLIGSPLLDVSAKPSVPVAPIALENNVEKLPEAKAAERTVGAAGPEAVENARQFRLSFGRRKPRICGSPKCRKRQTMGADTPGMDQWLLNGVAMVPLCVRNDSIFQTCSAASVTRNQSPMAAPPFVVPSSVSKFELEALMYGVNVVALYV